MNMIDCGTVDDWIEFRDLVLLSAKRSVSITLHYSKCENAWYGVIDSPAPSEETITKTYSLKTVLKILREHLEKLNK